MSEVTSSAALTTAREALSARHDAVVIADRSLVAGVAEAHAATVGALARLDTIEAEIDDAVSRQHQLALDTPTGVSEFQHFLLAKRRDITTVVTDATALAEAKVAELSGLADTYRPSSSRTV